MVMDDYDDDGDDDAMGAGCWRLHGLLMEGERNVTMVTTSILDLQYGTRSLKVLFRHEEMNLPLTRCTIYLTPYPSRLPHPIPSLKQTKTSHSFFF